MVKLSKTFKEVGQEFLGIPQVFPADFDVVQATKGYVLAVEEYSKYLDGFRTMDSDMQILAYQKAREIDREVLFAMAAELPKERVEQIINGVYSRHRHSKVENNEVSEKSEETKTA